jgi:hypothetical protein
MKLTPQTHFIYSYHLLWLVGYFVKSKKDKKWRMQRLGDPAAESAGRAF